MKEQKQTKLYFAYGANISKTAMRYRCPSAKPVGSFMFQGWELEFFHHANIRRSSGASVPGALWELDAESEESLDMFEGFPHYYKKLTATQGGKTFFFYVMNEGKTGAPSQSYIDGIVEGYQQWGLPIEPLKKAIDNVNERISKQNQGQFQPRKRNPKAIR